MDITRLSANTEEIITLGELERLLASDRPLNIKLGVDPTSADLHLGHAVVLRKLRLFQEAGHQTFLVIGDFTASIGDPAGVNTARPVLSDDEIRSNMRTYLEQAELILDMNRTHVVYNSEWLKTMNLGELIGYAMQVTLNQLSEREDFATRLQEGNPVGFHECLYPLVQAIDSVHLKADIELGGGDQRLNLLMARDLQKKLGQPPQVIIMMKLLVGTDGHIKMSKSKGNYIGLAEPASQMFGKLMKLPDRLIDPYAESHDINLASAGDHPRARKALMAKEMVAIYHDDEAAAAAERNFDSTFRDKQIDDSLVNKIEFDSSAVPAIQAVTRSASVSTSEAKRLFEQNGIKLNNQPVTDPQLMIDLSQGRQLLQVGKHRFFELEWKKG